MCRRPHDDLSNGRKAAGQRPQPAGVDDEMAASDANACSIACRRSRSSRRIIAVRAAVAERAAAAHRQDGEDEVPGAKSTTRPVSRRRTTRARTHRLRWAPEGDIPLAPQLQVTFSQAMVAVTSHADTVAGGVPVTLSPQPPGQWRGSAPRPAVRSDIRSPATTYTVTIPKGRSRRTATSSRRRSSSRSRRRPDAAEHVSVWGPHHTDVPFYVQFDQKIDAAACSRRSSCTGGKKTFSLCS